MDWKYELNVIADTINVQQLPKNQNLTENELASINIIIEQLTINKILNGLQQASQQNRTGFHWFISPPHFEFHGNLIRIKCEEKLEQLMPKMVNNILSITFCPEHRYTCIQFTRFVDKKSYLYRCCDTESTEI
jgi:hypothetical protein